MIPEVKYFQNNWVHGMKVSEMDFIHADRTTQDWFRDLRASVFQGNYGLLPSVDAGLEDYSSQYPKFKVEYDQPASISIRLEETRAVLQNGIRVEITSHNSNNDIPASSPSIPINRDRNGDFDIFLSIESIEYQDKRTGMNELILDRISAGPPAEGGQPRLAYVTHRYKLYVEKSNNVFNPNQLRIAQINIDNGRVDFKTYIPPCLYVSSHPKLREYHHSWMDELEEIRQSCIKMLQEGRFPEPLADKVLAYIASTIHTLQHQYWFYPPIALVTYYKNLAEITHSYLEAMTERNYSTFFNPATYPDKECDRDEQNIEEAAKTLIDATFNPNDLATVMEDIDRFMSVLKCVFDKLSSDKKRRTSVEDNQRPTNNQEKRTRRTGR